MVVAAVAMAIESNQSRRYHFGATLKVVVVVVVSYKFVNVLSATMIFVVVVAAAAAVVVVPVEESLRDGGCDAWSRRPCFPHCDDGGGGGR